MPSDGTNAVSLHVRDEFENTGIEEAVVGDIERRLTLWERVSNMDPVRKLSVLVLLVVAWEIYTRSGEINELMFPTFLATAVALVDSLVNAGLLVNVWNSISLLFTGYCIGIGIAAVDAIEIGIACVCVRRLVSYYLKRRLRWEVKTGECVSAEVIGVVDVGCWPHRRTRRTRPHSH